MPVALNSLRITDLISENSSVGKILGCEQSGKTMAFKLFILGKPGYEDIEKMQDQRDILIQSRPLFQKLSQNPRFIGVGDVVTEDGKENGTFSGYLMEKLEGHRTLYQLVRDYKAQEIVPEPFVILKIFDQL